VNADEQHALTELRMQLAEASGKIRGILERIDGRLASPAPDTELRAEIRDLREHVDRHFKRVNERFDDLKVWIALDRRLTVVEQRLKAKEDQ
jgi:hypothetical protein